MTKLALSIGAPEYFGLGVMALGLVSVASKGETIKGLIMALLGLALSTVGQDEVTGLTYRFSCGILSLEAGIPIVVSTLGVFALSQVLMMFEEGGSVAKAAEVKDSILSGFPEVIKRPLTLLRAGTVGWFIGILPALGVSLAGIASYLVEKKYSREGEQFGTWSPGRSGSGRSRQGGLCGRRSDSHLHPGRPRIGHRRDSHGRAHHPGH